MNLWAKLLLAGASAAAFAARADDAAVTALPGVDVVAVTPAPGPGLPRDRLALSAVIVDAADISRSGVPDFTGALLADAPSVALNDVEGNPFQPDLQFRGFTASPVGGTPEGLAVYVNGVRFNEAFGDTVNWDLIPATAVQSAVIESANPLFGLNALGGSVNVRLKNGFSWRGESLTAYGGSYGRRAGIVELGGRTGALGLYLNADVTHDGGFRKTGASDLKRLFGDVGWRNDGAEVHLALTLAHDKLGNPGATPVQALNANIANIFTAPNTVDNQYAGATLNGTFRLGDTLSLQTTAYGDTLTQFTPNGVTTEVGPCDGGGGLLCNPDGTVVTGPGGAPVPDFLNGGPYSGLSTQLIVTHAYGAAIQVDETARLAGRDNHLVVGAAYDGSDSVFAGALTLGGFDPHSRGFIGPGVIQDQPAKGVNPVRVLSVTRAWGVFADDLISLSPTLDLNLSGRLNLIRVGLQDQLGGPVNGRHDFGRFNPGAGLVWRPVPGLALHLGYAETNRAPTPQELSCASAAAPCSLLNFFVGDPNLRQVVARTVEVGARGGWGGAARLTWSVDYFRTSNSDDITFEPAAGNPNLAYYTNAGRTQRQGVEANLRYARPRFTATLGYAYVDATFQSFLLLNAGANPFADANGELQVRPGDALPGIPRHRATLALTWTPNDRWTLGADVTAQSSVVRFGDPSNLAKSVGGYARLDLDASYRASRQVTVFASVKNALNTRYDTYGAFGPVGDTPWPDVPGGVTDPRTASPGSPIAAFGGVRISY